MAKRVKFSGKKKSKGGDMSFDFGYNVKGVKKPRIRKGNSARYGS
jgi:hypothetical protein